MHFVTKKDGAFFNVGYNGKTVLFQCIKDTKRHILIKRIFHRFGIEYDAGCTRRSKFVDENGVEVPIGSHRSFGAKIFMILSGDGTGNCPIGSKGNEDGIEGKDEIVINRSSCYH